jgi:PKD repeat protein
VRRRFALALALALLAIAGAGVAAADQNSGQLVTATVYGSGGTTNEFVSIGTLEANAQNCPEYTGPDDNFVGPQGGSQLPATSWSIATVLGCMQPPIQLGAIHDVVVRRQDGTPETGSASALTQADLSSPSDFTNTVQNPVISSDGSNIVYNRPPRGPGDNNQADQVYDSNPSPFALDVFEGPPLNVKINASQTSVTSGATVDFSSTVTGPNDTGLSYSWDFQGGAPDSKQAAPQETFSTSGQYRVTLEVTNSAGGGGGDTIELTVGSPQQGPAGGGGPQGPTGGNGPQTHTTSQHQSPRGQTHHATHPSGRHAPQGRAATHNGSSRQKPSHSRRPTPSVGGSSAPTGPSPTGGGTGPVSSAPYQAPAAATTPTHSQPAPQNNPAPPAPPHAHPLVVDGLLISAVSALPLSASPLGRDESGGATAVHNLARRAGGTGPLPVVATALIAILLLALGARRELRGQHNMRRPRFAG